MMTCMDNTKKYLSGLKVQKESLLEARRAAKEDNERAREKHDKEVKELE